MDSPDEITIYMYVHVHVVIQALHGDLNVGKTAKVFFDFILKGCTLFLVLSLN